MTEPYGHYKKESRAIFGPNFFSRDDRYVKESELVPFYSEPQYPGQEPFAYAYGICLFFVEEVEELEGFKPQEGWDALAYLGVEE